MYYSCRECVVCAYCTEDCCIKSWNDSHKYECCGLRNDFWYEIGIGFPVFKALLKGKRSHFQGFKKPYSKNSIEWNVAFGSVEDNYPYFNTLSTNMEKISNTTPLLLVRIFIVIWVICTCNLPFLDGVCDSNLFAGQY